MSTNLTTVDAHISKARDYARQGEDYYVRAGRELRLAKEACESSLEFQTALQRADMSLKTAERWLRLADAAPEERERFRKRDAARKKVERTSAPKPRRENNDLIAPMRETPAGELHEATRGFQAAMRRVEKLNVSDPKWMQWRETALAHFKRLVESSTLPQVAGLSADDIIRLLDNL